MAPAYKLTYFDSPALGEPIRWLFSYGGIEFEDIRLSRDLRDSIKTKLNTPFGQVPILEYNGKLVAQHVAISRYVGHLVGLGGKDDWEDLEIDSVVDSFSDMRNKSAHISAEKDEAAKQKLRVAFMKDTAPFYLDRFEEIVKKNNGYFVNGHLTWADVYVACMIHLFIIAGLKPFENRPNLEKLTETVKANKNIQEYLKIHPIP